MSLACLGFLAVSACGGSSDLTPVDACNQAMGAMCDKMFSCAGAMAAQLGMGANAADCKTQLVQQNCTADQVACPAGKTFQSAAAQTCIDTIKGMSCTAMTSSSSTPAGCDDTAVCK